jgi:hypothetical protein
MVIERKGNVLETTVRTPHGTDLKMSGGFKDGKLTMKTGAEEHHPVTLSAILKDGTLTGSLSGERGEFKWTAKRAQ